MVDRIVAHVRGEEIVGVPFERDRDVEIGSANAFCEKLGFDEKFRLYAGKGA